MFSDLTDQVSQFSIKHFVDPIKAAFFFEDALVQRLAIDQRVLSELFSDALQPTALGLGPRLRGKNRLHGVANAFLKRFQGRVEYLSLIHI